MTSHEGRGRAYFIGAGPGDPGLLTLRGAELLSRSDVVLFDPQVHQGVLDRGPEERIAVGERGGALDDPQRIAAKIVALARAGKVVARLTEGDPYLFATGDEEVALVSKEGVPFEVVPGILGSLAAGAYAGLPLSRRADASPCVALVDARAGLQVHEWAKVSDATDAIAVLVARADLDELARTLIFHGRLPDAPSAVLVDVSLPTQDVVTGPLVDIARLAARVKASPVRLFVGDVVGRRNALRWFDTRPLFGKRVLVTRARDQAAGTAELLGEWGAEPIVVPTIEIHPPRDPEALALALAQLASFSWVVFTSANGVERTWAALAASGKDARAFGAARIAAVGPVTADALAAHGLRADVRAKDLKGEGLAEELLRAMPSASSASVLILRAEEAREIVPDTLRAAGCVVDVVGAYENRPAPGAAARLRDLIGHRRVDAVTFTSSSTVDNVCDALGDEAPKMLAEVRVASIGPITTATASKRGIRVDVTARESTVEALVQALAASFQKN
jgi:uroporphyrinogen III methyltransferase/synthase